MLALSRLWSGGIVCFGYFVFSRAYCISKVHPPPGQPAALLAFSVELRSGGTRNVSMALYSVSGVSRFHGISESIRASKQYPKKHKAKVSIVGTQNNMWSSGILQMPKISRRSEEHMIQFNLSKSAVNNGKRYKS